MNLELPNGLCPVMLTPFRADKTIDFDALEQLVEFYIRGGADLLFTNCLSSEMYLLTRAERIALCKAVVKASKGRVPVIGSGNFYSEAKENAEFIKELYDQGLMAVVLITNQMVGSGETDDVLKLHIDELLIWTDDIPLGLYECPDPYKRKLTLPTLQWIADTHRFFYYKETSCHLPEIKSKIEVLANSTVKLFNADTVTAYSSLQSGAGGVAAISANFFPEWTKQIIELAQSGSLVENESSIIDQLIVRDTLIHQCYPFSAKLFLQKRGLKIQEHCRIQFKKMTSREHIQFETLFQDFIYQSNKYQINLIATD